ncbi:reverse transcriptase family protein [Pseudomonas alloputida]|uniref:reverse transcriptase family protein n=1 Tax=Pseudomonas alloputida TaxID=1940621 RepID=UPI003B42B89E
MANEKPYYRNRPIGSVDALAQCLGVTKQRLLTISENAKNSYTEFTRESEKNGVKKERILNEPKAGLKAIQKKINREIFEGISYPDYLHGGLKERDYVTNVAMHARAKSIIGLDIKDFYPSIKKEHVLDMFKNLFRFPTEVCNILIKLTLKNGKVAQGGCCSSYIANLIFFNSEYSKVSKLRAKGLNYTRLLDDITISSTVAIQQNQAEKIIEEITGLFTKFKLELNRSKTKIEHSADPLAKFEVTGLWAAHGEPKLRKKDRRYVRQLVHICTKEYKKDPYSKHYHKLWNMTSGKVAVLTRLQHAQANSLRADLGRHLPLYDDDASRKLQRLAYKLCQVPESETGSPSKLKVYRKLRYHFGIVARNDKSTASHWKCLLDTKFGASAENERKTRI